MGVNRQFQAKRAKYENCKMSQNIKTIVVQFSEYTKSKMADGCHIENRKYAISRPRIV